MRYVDRSRREAAQFCMRSRWWGYEFKGQGIQLRGFSPDLLIGSSIHVGCEAALQYNIIGSDQVLLGAEDYAANQAIRHFSQSYNELGLQPTMVELEDGSWSPLDYNATQKSFMINLVEVLVRGWIRVRLPKIMEQFNILDVEKEESYQLTKELRFLSRSDFIGERKLDKETFVFNLKSGAWVTYPSWRKKWRYDQQTLSELLGVEQRLGRKLGGVIIEGINKGGVNIEYPKGSGQKFNNSPLMWAWMGPPNDPFPTDVRLSYEWVDETGKNRRLGPSYNRRPAYEVMPIRDWLDKVEREAPALLEAQFVSLPPILRSEEEIEEWRYSTVAAERDIDESTKIVEALVNDDPYVLAEEFPKTTSNGQCLGYGSSPCPFFQICWEGASPDDPGLYMPRVANHPEPREEQP